jgi:hypothetical protein
MAKELSFPMANVTLSDPYLLTVDMQVEWPEVLRAEVVTRRYPVDWRTFIRIYLVVFLGFALFWAAAPFFGWFDLPGPMVALFWLLLTILAARDQAKRSYKHTLTIHTTSGTIDAATLEYDNTLLDASEAINKLVKRYAATPRPSQPGEPTRLMGAN